MLQCTGYCGLAFEGSEHSLSATSCSLFTSFQMFSCYYSGTSDFLWLYSILVYFPKAYKNCTQYLLHMLVDTVRWSHTKLINSGDHYNALCNSMYNSSMPFTSKLNLVMFYMQQ